MMFSLRIRSLKACAAFFGTIIAITLPIGCERLKNYSDADHVTRAKSFEDKGDLQSAIIELKNALQKNPSNREARWLLGDVYVRTGQGSEAEKELTQAAKLGVNPESLKVSMGRALVLQGEYKRAIDEVQVSQNSSQANTAKILEIRGRAFLGLKQPSEGCPLFEQALKSDATYILAHLGLARCMGGQGRVDEARSTIQKAIKLDSNSGASWILLGDLERGQNRLDAAESAYSKAIQIRPDNLDALLGRATTRIQAKKFPAAKEDITIASKRVQDHPLLSHLNGVIQFKENKLTDAKTSFESALKRKPDYMPSVLWLGLTHYGLKNYEQALTQVRQYIQVVPQATHVQALEALILAKLGDHADAQKSVRNLGISNIEDPQTLALLAQAEMLIGDDQLGAQTLSKLIEKSPQTAEVRAALAMTLAKQHNSKAAIQEWEKAIQLNPKLIMAEEGLVRTLIQEKKFDQALVAIDAFQQRHPESPMPQNYRGVVLLLQGNEEDAKKAFTKSIELQPGFPAAAHNLALIALRKKDLNGAREAYQKVLAHEKDHLPTLLALYQLDLQRNNQPAARKWLESAIASHPAEVEPAALLAQSYLGGGEARKALDVSQAAAASKPENTGLLEVRGLAYLNAGDPGNALASFKHLLKLQPASSQASFYESVAYTALGDLAGARSALTDTLRLDPKHFQARAALARLELKTGKFDEASRVAKELQKLNPSIPDGYIIEADVNTQQKRYRDAIRVLETAQKQFPNSDTLIFKLAQNRLSANDGQAAIAPIQAWQKANPSDARGPQFLAAAYSRLGREKEAVAAFEAVLKLSPDDMVALNNLALLLQKSEPERAVTLIEKAVKLNPKSPALLDTLGWMRVEQGKTKEGMESLKEAVALAPGDPTIRYHFAAGLARSGDKATARRELEKLLSSNPQSAIAKDAKALLGQL
ncbi:MAG: XrtA/PEP-CTERM system TPR-repeat protein PrsT [Pseudomonadota bacterium]